MVLVVLEPTAAPDFDRAHDVQRLGDGAASRGQRGLIKNLVFLVGPRRALRAKRIVKVNVSVNDGDGIQ